MPKAERDVAGEITHACYFPDLVLLSSYWTDENILPHANSYTPSLPCFFFFHSSYSALYYSSSFFWGGSYICMFKWADYRGRTSDSKYQEISLVFHISILFRIFNSFCLSLWNCSKCPNNDKHSCQAFKFHFFTSLHTSWNLYWFSLSFNVALLSAASAIIDKWSSLIEQEQSGRAK